MSELLQSGVPAQVVTATRTVGRTFRLGARATAITVFDIASGRFPWREALVQAWFFVTVTAVPAVLLSVPFGVVIAVQIGSLTKSVGANSMAGAIGGIGVMQQGAPLAAALLVGGAGASAVAADLGSRTVREEIDAMRTMGIDPQQRLVAPRLLAVMIVAPMLAVLIVMMSIVASYLVAIVGQNVASGSYWLSFGTFASVSDLVICIVKAIIFGYIVVVVAAQRGLEARGGPRGVADGVNAAVVIGVVSCVVVNVAITQLVAMFIPPRLF
ncbi:MlaE family ABC transporter permease [Nocardia vaccinii]|uniref:MlaE family ABC transporter permease n=1 Tax=Nocardia vaccinii TaxID=1822 RepID=UPI000ABBDA12|nr:ABC transporter permease [Nocardia vaccinii]